MSMQTLVAAKKAESKGFHPDIGRGIANSDGFPENALNGSKRQKRVFQVAYEFLAIEESDPKHLKPFRESKRRASDVLDTPPKNIHQLFSSDLFGEPRGEENGRESWHATDAKDALNEVIEYIEETDGVTVEDVLKYGDEDEGN